MNNAHLTIILSHIFCLLREEKSLFVDDLGYFFIEEKSATLENGIIYPPKNVIQFVHESDEYAPSLAIRISKVENISLSEVSEMIKQWVADLRRALEHNKSIEFENFGTFSLCGNGLIDFSSQEELPDLNQKFEGFTEVFVPEKLERTAEEPVAQVVEESAPEPVIEIPAVEEEPVVEKHTEIEPEAVIEEEPALIEESIPVVISAEEEEEKVEEENREEENSEDDEAEEEAQSKKSRKTEKWLFALVIVITLVTLGLLAKDHIIKYYNELANSEQPVEAPVEVPEEEEDIVKEDSFIADTLEVDTTAIAEEAVPVEAPEEVPQTVVQGDGNYAVVAFEKGKFYVIAGSFVKEEIAVKHIKEKQLESYNPILVTQGGSDRLRVCVGVFPSEREAQNFVNQTNSKYWVLK